MGRGLVDTFTFRTFPSGSTLTSSRYAGQPRREITSYVCGESC